MNRILTCVAIFIIAFSCMVYANEFDAALMQSTFKIVGNKVGTGFVLGIPMKEDPKQGRYVLITADHVLREMTVNEVVLILRKKNENTWTRQEFKVPIRAGGKELWVKHPAVDVAAMLVTLPNECKFELLPTTLLADDAKLKEFNIQPGDDLNCLGFPLGAEGNSIGFPILRSGKISSFPLAPIKEFKTFLFDFSVFGGNSGGPVYLTSSTRQTAGGLSMGSFNLILGLVSTQIDLNEAEKFEGLTKTKIEVTRHPLALAEIVQAPYILETINLLNQN